MNAEKEIIRINKIIDAGGKYQRSFGKKKEFKHLTREMKLMNQGFCG